MKAKLISIAVLAACLAPQPVLPQANTGSQIYGSQLMTAQERDQYRERMRAATTDEERERIRAEHHERMNERAKARGLSLPDQPARAGYGAGPGTGGGMGAGPGGGMGAGPGGGGHGSGGGGSGAHRRPGRLDVRDGPEGPSDGEGHEQALSSGR